MDSRSEFRLTVDIAVSIKPYRLPAQNLVMSDVSTAGALVTGKFRGLFKGQEIILVVGDMLSMVATIVWVETHAFGLAFHRRMHGFEFDDVMQMSRTPGISADVQSVYRDSRTG
ncbi:PilZ domain-containing protein [Sphingomonas abietis]|uniref:PilZ domain-containing protein n=1 Tax=Sphingomonas abietis TaxID=3012344 RepID=A0ABY7NPJ8_9SPHN|nr:PilZ domain-containing protein [Sphingomonas abietis]WBO23455.1 PilZ domain-containing protein [Sphingomonas abietis]